MLRAMIRIAALAALALACAAPGALAKDITLPPSGDNPWSKTIQQMGMVNISVEYSSPDVHGPDGRDRRGHIWGELVPYGLSDLGYNGCTKCPWRGGANENTVFTVSHDVKIEGKPLPAGSYGLHFIPGKDEWVVIFSRDSKAWGSYWYDPAKDQLRVSVKPAAAEYHEWLTYEFTERGTDHATLALKWEDLQVPLRVSVDDWVGLYVANLEDEFRNAQAFQWKTFMDAANFCLGHKSHLDKGLRWAQDAVSRPGTGVANFETLTTLSRLQGANGLKDDAAKTLDLALAQPAASALEIHAMARTLQTAGENDVAKRLFLLNAERHPGQWPVPVGLARAAAIDGKFAEAAALARKAAASAPDEGNKRNLENLAKQWDEAAAKK